MRPSMKAVVVSAVEACKSFAECSTFFFNHNERQGWLGWENWLSVDIVRRLNHESVFPFYSYPGAKLKLDIFVKGPVPMAVEIKVNFISDAEVKAQHRRMSGRVLEDARKMEMLDKSFSKLLLVSTCFESGEALDLYPKRVARDLETSFRQFQRRWYDCSAAGGHNRLLVMWHRG